MEPILIVSNLVLIGLTGTYAWLTSKSNQQLKQESIYYRSVIEKQLKFSALPHLYWDLRPAEAKQSLAETEQAAAERPHAAHQTPGHLLDSGQRDPLRADLPTDQVRVDQPRSDVRSDSSAIASQSSALSSDLSKGTPLALEVFNISNVPAYDVHVSVIGAYTEEGQGIATFMRTHVQPRHRKYPLQADKVGYYGVRNALRLSLLPTQQKIVLSLPFPIQPVDVYTLMQYRELSGQNYYQVCCFSAIDESGAYRANILEPSSVQSIERLHLFDIEDFTLSEPVETNSATEKDAVPYYLADFIDLWNHSISSRLMLKASAAVKETVPAKATYEF